MRISSAVTHSIPPMVNSDGFKSMLQDHLHWLTFHNDTTIIEVEGVESHRYASNLNGYLDSKSIPSRLHWVIMKLSNITTPLMFGDTTTHLIIPSEQVVDDLLLKYSLSL